MDDHDTDLNALFTEPSDFYQAEKPTTEDSYQILSGDRVTLRFLGQSPLWGHLLWGGERVTTQYLEERADTLIKGRRVLELGAGGGLAGIVCAIHGAAQVVITDYPDDDLIENIRYNVHSCPLIPDPNRIRVEGYIWGQPVADLICQSTESEFESNRGFDTLILADLVFNHSQHHALIASVQQTLRKDRDAKALVFFTPYRPKLYENDMNFFTLAGAPGTGLVVRQVLHRELEKPMFEDDPGDRLLRRTVFGYELTWDEAHLGR